MIDKNHKDYYPLLWECILSGQVSARQIQEHLKDKDFKKWIETERENNERKT